MGFVDRVNRAFFRRLRAQSPRYAVETDAVRVTHPDGRDYRLLFADLTTATLHHRDVYAYDAIILALGFTNGETIEFAQDDPDWEPLVHALDRSGRIGEPSNIWQLQAIGDGDGAPVRHLPIT